MNIGQVGSLRALPQQRKPWLLWLCRATAKLKPTQYSKKVSSNQSFCICWKNYYIKPKMS